MNASQLAVSEAAEKICRTLSLGPHFESDVEYVERTLTNLVATLLGESKAACEPEVDCVSWAFRDREGVLRLHENSEYEGAFLVRVRSKWKDHQILGELDRMSEKAKSFVRFRNEAVSARDLLRAALSDLNTQAVLVEAWLKSRAASPNSEWGRLLSGLQGAMEKAYAALALAGGGE